MKSREQLIHEASMRILERTGMKFEHPDAIKVLKENGIKVDDEGVAYFTEEQVMYWVRKAPHSFTLYARNPEHNIVIGGDILNPAPGYGCPYVVDKDGQKRASMSDDFIKFAKLFHQCDSFHVNGGILVQPNDLPIDNVTLLMFYMTYLYSDKCLLTGTADGEQVAAMMEMAKLAFGGEEEFKKYPRLITLINTVTPLQLTNVMTESLFQFVKYRQPIVVGSLGQAGTTAPITLAGAITVSNAEVLAGIALAQMISPGTPCIYGSETTTADMRSGATAIGSPEGAICYKYGGKMADFYGIPSRAGGCLSDAKAMDPQAGYESMITFMACREANINFMIHAAGIMDAYASMSYEKLMVDFEVIDYVNRYTREFEINEETIPEDLIDEIGHDGQYLTEEHTFEHCRIEPLTPHISVRGNTLDPKNQFSNNVKYRVDEMLEEYKQPELDKEIIAGMRKILMDRGVEEELLNKLENM